LVSFSISGLILIFLTIIVRNRHPEGKIVIPNDNFGINAQEIDLQIMNTLHGIGHCG